MIERLRISTSSVLLVGTAPFDTPVAGAAAPSGLDAAQPIFGVRALECGRRGGRQSDDGRPLAGNTLAGNTLIGSFQIQKDNFGERGGCAAVAPVHWLAKYSGESGAHMQCGCESHRLSHRRRELGDLPHSYPLRSELVGRVCRVIVPFHTRDEPM